MVITWSERVWMLWGSNPSLGLVYDKTKPLTSLDASHRTFYHINTARSYLLITFTEAPLPPCGFKLKYAAMCVSTKLSVTEFLSRKFKKEWRAQLVNHITYKCRPLREEYRHKDTQSTKIVELTSFKLHSTSFLNDV